MDDTPQNELERLELIRLVCGDVPAARKLDTLSTAWALLAAEARNNALLEPGGFPAERARQLELLGRLVALTEAAAPDLELERMVYEGDHEGLKQRLLDALREDDASTDDRPA
jgi:hypothetical protein